MHNVEYCTVQSKKCNFIPLAPQPDESDIVVMTRYHTALKRQTTYKKRATWFNNTGLHSQRRHFKIGLCRVCQGTDRI